MVGTWAHRVAGVDLGQTGDNSACAVLEQKKYDAAFVGPRYEKIKCVALRKWPLGTDYCQVVSDLLTLPVDVLVIEFNGVGRPVVDLARREAKRLGFKGRIRPVVTSASNVKTRRGFEEGGSHWVVPKVELVTSAKLLAEQGRIAMPNVPETKMLLDEMRAFQMRVTKSANLQFGAVRGKHDDLVMAFCLACWYVSRIGSRQLSVFC